MFLYNRGCFSVHITITIYTISLTFILQMHQSMKWFNEIYDFSARQWNRWSSDVILASIDTIAANCRCSRSRSIAFAVGARHRKQCRINDQTRIARSVSNVRDAYTESNVNIDNLALSGFIHTLSTWSVPHFLFNQCLLILCFASCLRLATINRCKKILYLINDFKKLR